MPSTFTWLDYSEHDRQKMVDVISAFREQDTRDELGIGAIRDGFADILFPGTSTIQTRARYFLFIPWIYLDLEQNKLPSSEAAQLAREREISLINALAKSDDRRGIIGIDARNKLKRLPSNIYWQGLRLWGIRQFAGSQGQYYRSLDRFYLTKGQMLRSDDKDIVSGFSEPNWHSGVPPKSSGFPWEASLKLRAEDSEYLSGRILSRVGASLLAHFVDQDSVPTETEFVWGSEYYGSFPAETRNCVDHARCFSETIHGAALLYNLMLAEKSQQEELIEKYRVAIDDWAEMIEDRDRAMFEWSYNDIWGILDKAEAHISKRTSQFVIHWIKRSLSIENPREIADDIELRNLILNRELMLKRGQARLDNPRALELWSGAAGTGRLDFRWKVSRGILADIMEGFSNA